MQPTGSLKKRRRRNLAKVNGLSIIPYNEEFDTFTLLWGLSENTNCQIKTCLPEKSNLKKEANVINFTSKEIANYRRELGSSPSSSYNGRVTRDPRFHSAPQNIICIEEAEQDEKDTAKNVPNSQHTATIDAKNIPNDQSRLLDKSMILRLKQLTWLSTCIGAFPWQWNDNKFKLEKWSPSMYQLWKMQFTLYSLQTFGIFLFQIYQFGSSLQAGDRTNREYFMTSFGVVLYGNAVAEIVNTYFYQEKTRQYINALLDFNNVFVDKYLIHLDGYKLGGKKMLSFCFFSNFSQIGTLVMMFVKMPFMPWFLTSYILPKPWYWLLPGAFQEFVRIGRTVMTYMLTAWIFVAHTNTVRFWLRESHNNNNSDYTSDELRIPENAVNLFKKLLVLNNSLNECISPLAIIMLKFCNLNVMIQGGYVLVRSMNHLFLDEFPGILTYPFAILTCGSVGFVTMNMAADIYDLGCGFIDSWNRTKQTDLRRVLMSLPTLKVWTGRFYFITVGTLTTFFRIIFDNVANCVMTFP